MANQDVSVPEKREVAGGEQTRPGRVFSPPVDIYETKEGLWLWADMPGVDESSLDVSVDQNVLTIQGQVAPQEYTELRPMYAEYPVGNYHRQFTLSRDIDTGRIQAKMNHGVLEIALPKAEAAKPRRIEVAVH